MSSLNSKSKILNSCNAGFTLLELLTYVGILSVVSALMVGILTTLVRVQNQSTSLVEVSNQSQFILQTIQRNIRDASAIIVRTNATSTSPANLDTDSSPAEGLALRLKTNTVTRGTVTIYLDGTTVKMDERNDQTLIDTTSSLTNSRVTVTDLTFKKRSNPPGRDVVLVSLTMSYNTSNPQLSLTRTFESAISHVSAAVFDSDLLPTTANVGVVGSAAAPWSSGYFTNNIITSAGKLGVQNTSPTYEADITGGLRVTTTSTFSGNVGIGTTTPSTNLHVVGGLKTTATTTFQGTNGNIGVGTTTPAALFTVATSNVIFAVTSGGNVGIGTSTLPSTLFSIATTTNIFNVLSSGFVGIGTSTPVTGLVINKGATWTTSGWNRNLILTGQAMQFGYDLGATNRIGIGNSGGILYIWTVAGDTASDALVYRMKISTTVDIPDVSGNSLGVGGNLDVNGSVAAKSYFNQDFSVAATTNGLCHSGADIDVAATGVARWTVVCSGAPGDVAEWYETTLGVETGDLVAVTDKTFVFEEEKFNPKTGESTGKKVQRKTAILAKTDKAYQENMVGVISESPYQTFGHAVRDATHAKNPQPVALSGRVPVKVSLENGEIKAGDLLASALKPGYAMKATKTGRVIGMALESFDGSAGSNEGKVLVFVNPHDWVNPKDYETLSNKFDNLQLKFDALIQRLGL